MKQGSDNEFKDLPTGADVANTSGFLKSLVYLVVALGVAFLVFYPTKKRTWDERLAERAAERDLTDSKRDLRSKSRDELAKSSSHSSPDQSSAWNGDAQGADPSNLHTDHQPKAEGYEYRGNTSTASSITSNLSPDLLKAIQLIDSGKGDEAVVILEAIVKAEPNNEQAIVELAMVNLLDLKRPDLAIQWLERGASVNPDNRIVMSELVSLYSEQNQVESGISYLKNLAVQQPNSPDIAYGIGQLLANEGRDTEAIPHLEKAAGSANQKDRILQELGDAYSRQSDSARASEAYQRSLEIQQLEIAARMQQGLPVAFPEERLNNTKLDLARELYQLGQLQKAAAFAEEVRAYSPEDQSAIALLAQIKKGRPL